MVILDKGAVNVLEMHPLSPPAMAVANISPKDPEVDVDEFDDMRSMMSTSN